MGAQPLIVGVPGHADASPPPTWVLPGKARRMTSARPARSTLGSAPAGPRSLARSASATAPGGRFSLRSHGRAVVNWLNTIFSRASRWAGVRTIVPEPAGARWWVTRTTPAGLTTSTVAVPRRWRNVNVAPANPGGTEYRLPRNATLA